MIPYSRSRLDTRIAAAVDELDSHLLALSCVASPEARKAGMRRIIERHLVDADRAEHIRILATHIEDELGEPAYPSVRRGRITELATVITQYLDRTGGA